MTSSERTFTVLGHRGAKGHAPENTLPSFEKAIELGATMAELDIHLSRDDKLVVMHDKDVDRTTNGTGEIRELLWEEIQQLDAGSWYGAEFAGARVPRLEEVFDAVADRILINVEIKSGDTPYPGIVERLAKLLTDRNLIERVVVSSFEVSYLKALRPLLPDLELALLYSKPRPDVCQEALDEGWQALHTHLSQVSKPFVEEAHALGLIVRGWNPNEVDGMRPLIEAGVDGIGTDYPERLVELAKEQGVL